MYYRDNWLRWYYDDVEYGSKVDPYSKFEIKYCSVKYKQDRKNGPLNTRHLLVHNSDAIRRTDIFV